jgi:hypothetical protein
VYTEYAAEISAYVVFVLITEWLLVTRYGYGRHIDVIHDESKLVMFMKARAPCRLLLSKSLANNVTC